MPLAELGPDLNGAPETACRLCKPAKLQLHITQIAVGLRKVRLDGKRAPVADCGFLQTPRAPQGVSQVQVSHRIAGSVFHCLHRGLQSVLALFAQRYAEQLPGEPRMRE